MTSRPDLRAITEVGALVKAGTLSPVALVEGCLARIADGSDLNAFITVLGDSAMAEARAAERDIRAGRYRGPLHGIPISVKDLVDVAGTPTTAASAVPARQASTDAPLVRRLREAGAIIVGKTNLHEFAFGTTSDETAFGPVRHPKDRNRSPGGSSGGAAVALLEGMCFGSIGTDTGGSIRIPSAACGIVGLKPTLGELSCDGVVPLSTTLDHVGPMGRTLADVDLMFRALASRQADERETAGTDPAPVLGVPERYFLDRLDPEVRRAFDRTRRAIAGAGHEVAVTDIAGASATADVYLHICLPEASAFHAPTLDAHAAKYSPGVRLRLEMGRYILAEDMARAFQLRERLTRAVDDALARCHALLLPALPIVAPPIGAPSVDVDGESLPTRAAMLRLTQLFNITGHPAIAIPNGATSGGWPTSVQLVGRRGGTRALLRTAAALEPLITGGGS
jgi:aspartyl-tRNA(Asn)/glutamyl-tRNA(Gln) amidotransferase subunit A